jgi:hypothetical protein
VSFVNTIAGTPTQQSRHDGFDTCGCEMSDVEEENDKREAKMQDAAITWFSKHSVGRVLNIASLVIV